MTRRFMQMTMTKSNDEQLHSFVHFMISKIRACGVNQDDKISSNIQLKTLKMKEFRHLEIMITNEGRR
jgi:hypothetical protein